MIKLYQYPPIWGLPNASPFCMKVETYLRMVNLPYECKYIFNPSKAPKGKLPFIKDGERIIADSTLIIEYLQAKYGDSLDEQLTATQQAQKTAVQRLVEEHLYWVMVYFRWVDPQSWELTKKAFFGKLPFFLKLFVPRMVLKQTKKMLYYQGTGRHSAEEIYQFGAADIMAIGILLGPNKFFFGDQPTSIDATLYAFLANIIEVPMETPLKKYMLSKKNLVEYCQRMKVKYYANI